MPLLTEIKTGTSCIFIGLKEGGDRRRQRLADMGVLPGEPIKVLDNQGHGPVTIYVKGSKIALGHMLAKAIDVKEIAHEK